MVNQVFEHAKKKGIHMVLVANKFDALPKGAKYERVHRWIKTQTSNSFTDIVLKI